METTTKTYFPRASFRKMMKVDKRALITCYLIWIAAAFTLEQTEIITALDFIDRHMMLALNFPGSNLADHFWFSYSCLPTWFPLIGVALCSCLKLYPGSRWEKALFLTATALLIIVLDQLSSGLIKPLVGRLRPSHDPAIMSMLHYVNGYRGGVYGFVSGHATNAVGLATWFCLIFKGKAMRLALIPFAGMMCYSRIYLGVHYPGDIVCGALVGFVCAQATFRLLRSHIHLHTTDRQSYAVIITFLTTLIVILLTVQ